ncbi:hypothetical protein SESBI_03892 [Sesbania bispinosa]|nr:hypothetical protein SESBI_03892 [Sesbania bispinosa]
MTNGEESDNDRTSSAMRLIVGEWSTSVEEGEDETFGGQAVRSPTTTWHLRPLRLEDFCNVPTVR